MSNGIHSQQQQQQVILDLDTGIDDTLALAYALGSPELHLTSITGTYGNVTMDQGLRNDCDILTLLNATHVKVYRGADHSLTRDSFEVLPISAFIHGENGIGNITLPQGVNLVQNTSGVKHIIEAVDTYGSNLTYIPTGPLTNLALALQERPDIAERIGNVVMMGGALTIPGNVNAWTEANISQDPEAANIVFQSGIPITMIGLDVTLQTLLTVKETRQWRNLNTNIGDFLADMTDFYIDAYKTTAPHLGGCGLHDPLAVAVAADPTLVSTIAMNMKVDTDGPTRGRTIGDETRLNNPEKNVKVAVAVDVERFLHEFMRRISAVAMRA